MKKGYELRVFGKEENCMVFRVEMNENSTLVTNITHIKITRQRCTTNDNSNYLLIGNCEKSTLAIRCASIEEADKHYDKLKETKEKMSFSIRRNIQLCCGDCEKCPVYNHPLNKHFDETEYEDLELEDEDDDEDDLSEYF